MKKRDNVYLGSIILGLNDGIVEVTGTVAGLTLALQNTKLIALTTLITGIAAAMSMASSEYLAKKSEYTKAKPYTAALYTGLAYFLTIIILVIPYLLFNSLSLALSGTLIIALLIIFFFTLTTAKLEIHESWKKRFIEMTVLSLGIAACTFIIGFLLKRWFLVNIR